MHVYACRKAESNACSERTKMLTGYAVSAYAGRRSAGPKPPPKRGLTKSQWLRQTILQLSGVSPDTRLILAEVIGIARSSDLALCE